MKIAKYISDLIYDYECVVIPGLGGFISSQTSATINKATHQFKPPFKDIHFNIHLNANDGLLVNYVARNEQIPYKQAKVRVDKFVLLCHNALTSGKRINFSNIGYIFRDVNKNIVFKQDNTINYNAESFGLTSFISPAIRRPSDEDKIKEAFSKSSSKDSKPSSRTHSQTKRKDKRIPSESSNNIQIHGRSKPSKVKQQLLFVFVILFAMSSYYIFNRRDAMLYYWNANKHIVPFLYNHPNDYLSANAGLMHLEKLNVSNAGWLIDLASQKTDDKIVKKAINDEEKKLVEIKSADNNINADDGMPATAYEKGQAALNNSIADEPQDKYYHDNETANSADETIVPDEEPQPIAEEIPKLNSVNDYPETITDSYFIIAGSFGNRRNAERLVNELKSKGFDALVADTNSRGMFRVAYMGFNSPEEANLQLLAIREESNSQAWLLHK
ncbi:MAG: SPOR domain-containing protein [Chlorobi bacterium]|nr:SPOR domain-containing protein [Chlorobiota bacterium]